MKTLYLVKTSLMNGTVTIKTMNTVFATKELAEKALDYIKKQQPSHEFFTSYSNMEEVTLYETEDELQLN